MLAGLRLSNLVLVHDAVGGGRVLRAVRTAVREEERVDHVLGARILRQRAARDRLALSEDGDFARVNLTPFHSSDLLNGREHVSSRATLAPLQATSHAENHAFVSPNHGIVTARLGRVGRWACQALRRYRPS